MHGQLFIASPELAISNLQPATGMIKFLRVLESFLLLANWIFGRCKCNFEYRKHSASRNALVGMQNIEVYTLLGIMHKRIYARHTGWWGGCEGCSFLAVPFPQVFLYFSDLVLC